MHRRHPESFVCRLFERLVDKALRRGVFPETGAKLSAPRQGSVKRSTAESTALTKVRTCEDGLRDLPV